MILFAKVLDAVLFLLDVLTVAVLLPAAGLLLGALSGKYILIPAAKSLGL